MWILTVLLFGAVAAVDDLQCSDDSQCRPNFQCVDRLCQRRRSSSCEDLECGQFALCVGDLQPQCQCPQGLAGDPYVKCLVNFNELFDDVNASVVRDTVNNTQLNIDEFSGSLNDFAVNFYLKLLEEVGNETNLVFSPFSLHTALAMLITGAADNSTTQRQLLGAMGGFQNIQGIQRNYADILKAYTEKFGSTFNFANGLWTTESFFRAIKISYLNDLVEIYSTEMQELNFSFGDPVSEVNEWVSNQTRGKISKLFDRLSPDVQLLLVNAIFFKDSWTAPFDDETRNTEFNLINGRKVQAKMMTRTSFDFVRAEIEDFVPNLKITAISIPYLSHEQRFRMVLLVPERPVGIVWLEEHLSSLSKGHGDSINFLGEVNAKLAESRRNSLEEIQLTMPEFDLSSDIGAVNVLNKLGVRDVFSNAADLSGISEEPPLKVSRIKHKALIEVNKQGTVGAAVTGIELVPLSGSFQEPTAIVVDRPFILLVQDQVLNIPIFMGKVLNPVRRRK